jgi:hypothetical protein
MTNYTLALQLRGLVIEEIVFPGALAEHVRAVEAAVRHHNGRKRERTITVFAALRTIVKAHQIGAATTGREAVPKGYGYPADYVSCDAIRREDGSVIWAVGRTRCARKTVLGVSRIPAELRGQQIKTTAMRADGVIPAEIVAELAAILQPKEAR